jgi:hypothetical protein
LQTGSSRAIASVVSATDTSLVAIMSTTISWRAKTSAMRSRKPYCSSIGAATMLTTAMRSLLVIDLTARSAGARRGTTVVPANSGRKLFRTRIGMPFPIAGTIVAGCSTLAPKKASSAASAKESVGTKRASGTMRGSALITPSTSVQIWISAAPSAAPKIAAEKSLPPRPSVVMLPAASFPM